MLLIFEIWLQTEIKEPSWTLDIRRTMNSSF